jgi:DNA polymerase-3 subunit gamma/tau
VRRLWSELLGAVRKNSRSTEAMLTNATVQSIEGDTVTIAHTAAPLARRLGEPRNVDAIAKALGEVLGGQWQVKCVHAAQNTTTQSVQQKPRHDPPTFTRPNQPAAAPQQQQQAPEPPPPVRPVAAAVPAAAPPADEPPPPEPPDDDYYEDDGVPSAAVAAPPEPESNPEDDMVKLLTEQLGARPIIKR